MDRTGELMRLCGCDGRPPAAILATFTQQGPLRRRLPAAGVGASDTHEPSSAAGGAGDHSREDAMTDGGLTDPILQSAYQIVETMSEVRKYQTTIRTNYLGLGNPGDAFSASERDAVDTRSAALITKCKNSISGLESAIVSLRYLPQKQADAKSAGSHGSGFTLSKFLSNAMSMPRNIPQTHRDHYDSILWTLNNQLFKLSVAQQKLQEKRLKQDLAGILSDSKNANVQTPTSLPASSVSLNQNFLTTSAASTVTSALSAISAAATEIRNRTSVPGVLGIVSSQDNKLASSNERGANSQSLKSTSSSGSLQNNQKNSLPPSSLDISSLGMSDASFALNGQTRADNRNFTLSSTASQMQLQLEAENSSLLAQWQNNLHEVRKAEATLLAISQMQADIAQHLSRQKSTLESLWSDAETQNDQVNAGNTQLTRALDQTRGRRLWFLIFVICLSFILLFLDWIN